MAKKASKLARHGLSSVKGYAGGGKVTRETDVPDRAMIKDAGSGMGGTAAMPNAYRGKQDQTLPDHSPTVYPDKKTRI
jgi:hypothetical protein